MAIELFGIKNCDSCRMARCFLTDHGLEYEFVDLRDEPPTASLLADWLDRCDWQTLLNRRSRTWKSLFNDEREISNSEDAAALMRSHPLLIKRPVLMADRYFDVGFDAARWQAGLL